MESLQHKIELLEKQVYHLKDKTEDVLQKQISEQQKREDKLKQSERRFRERIAKSNKLADYIKKSYGPGRPRKSNKALNISIPAVLKDKYELLVLTKIIGKGEISSFITECLTPWIEEKMDIYNNYISNSLKSEINKGIETEI